jgi:Electron transfer DM13
VRRVAARAAAAVAAAALTLVGVWVVGGDLTDDASVARVLTGAWFVVTGGLAVAAGVRWRTVAVAVVGGWLVTSVAVGGFLLLTSSVDRTVDEDVARAQPSTSQPTTDPATPGQDMADRATLAASGRFRSGAHDTSGVASVVRLPSGHRVLTLTRFATSPGPDLRVYLVPPRRDIDDAVDLGRLKGNKGDQQYDVPRRARAGTVVIWCRAFSVEFGSAALTRSAPPT